MLQTITIKTRSATPGSRARFKVVSADVHGCLAIYETVGDAGKFTVGHIPTGLAVERGLERAVADELVRRLMGLDWSFTDPSAAAGLSGAVTLALHEAKVACRVL